uniref:Uncharacterized protein n=1 Tax=Glossina austeni TaxID=7395 RepID=A0A1A9ULP2_GLOAU
MKGFNNKYQLKCFNSSRPPLLTKGFKCERRRKQANPLWQRKNVCRPLMLGEEQKYQQEQQQQQQQKLRQKSWKDNFLIKCWQRGANLADHRREQKQQQQAETVHLQKSEHTQYTIRLANSLTKSSSSNREQLYIGLIAPHTNFGKREYLRAIHSAVSGLNKTRGAKLTFLKDYQFEPRNIRFDMMSLTPSPTEYDYD